MALKELQKVIWKIKQQYVFPETVLVIQDNQQTL